MATNTSTAMMFTMHDGCDSGQIVDTATIESLLGTEEQSKIIGIAAMHSNIGRL